MGAEEMQRSHEPPVQGLHADDIAKIARRGEEIGRDMPALSNEPINAAPYGMFQRVQAEGDHNNLGSSIPTTQFNGPSTDTMIDP